MPRRMVLIALKKYPCLRISECWPPLADLPRRKYELFWLEDDFLARPLHYNGPIRALLVVRCLLLRWAPELSSYNLCIHSSQSPILSWGEKTGQFRGGKGRSDYRAEIITKTDMEAERSSDL